MVYLSFYCSIGSGPSQKLTSVNEPQKKLTNFCRQSDFAENNCKIAFSPFLSIVPGEDEMGFGSSPSKTFNLKSSQWQAGNREILNSWAGQAGGSSLGIMWQSAEKREIFFPIVCRQSRTSKINPKWEKTRSDEHICHYVYNTVDAMYLRFLVYRPLWGRQLTIVSPP